MKLNTRDFRYLSHDDWRVLTAFEMGSKNHEVVPTTLAIQLADLRTGANTVQRCISTLAKAGLIARVKKMKYDGYRLTYGGFDYLALHAHVKSGVVQHMGSTQGVGKESDILLVTSPASYLSNSPIDANASSRTAQTVLKIHRLGRISFRTATTNRAYLGPSHHATSWQHLSRLSAQQEFRTMRVLRSAGFRVPVPIAHNRHTIVMSLVPGVQLAKVPISAFGQTREEQERGVAELYEELMDAALELAGRGVIHGDLNEFNVLLEGVPEDTELEDVREPREEEDIDHATPDIVIASDPLPSPEPESITSTATPDPSPATKLNSQPPPKLIPHLIDFPQVTSLAHPNAAELFERDIRGIKSFFRKRYHFESDDLGPTWADAEARLESAKEAAIPRLDVEMEAAGFKRRDGRREWGKYDAVDDALGNDNLSDGEEHRPEISLEDHSGVLATEPIEASLSALSIATDNTARQHLKTKTKAKAGWAI